MMGRVGTLIRATEAAAILNVTPATLYAYVSRGRLARTIAPDGRSSLFERDEVEQLAEQSRRASPGPRPTIDVQITSRVTTMGEQQLRYRGHDVAELVRSHHFEDIAELLWIDGTDPEVPVDTTWPSADRADVAACRPIAELPGSPIGHLAMAAHVLDAGHADDDPATAARRLLCNVPPLFGSQRRTGSFALRLAHAWQRRPSAAFVDVVDTALGLLADHELATSTLAVRIAASIHTSPYVALAAGLASVEGRFHGSAAEEVHRFLVECAENDPGPVIATRRRERRHVPGFGHKVYRGADPRFRPLLDALRPLDPDGSQIDLVEHIVAEVGRVLPHPPNIDLALGATTWISGLDPATPIFTVARIAGWTAHYAEELREPPLRFRGIARPG